MSPSFKIILALLNFNLLANGQDVESTSTACSSDKDIIEALLHRYGNTEPNDYKTDVAVETWIQDFTFLDPVKLQLSMYLYMSETWLDRQMSYEHFTSCKQNITTTGKIFDKIWTPKMHIINSINMERKDEDFVMIYPNGTVWRNYRINLIIPCTADFTKFPYESTLCSMSIESSIYNNDKIRLTFSNMPILLLSHVNLATHTFTNFVTTTSEELYPAGFWTTLTVRMKFQRRFGWYVKHVYAPSSALVFASFVSFCLGPAITARVLLTFGSSLALLLQYVYAIRDLPQLAYITSLEKWLYTCVAFALASLLELALYTLVSRSCCNNNATYGKIENETTKPLISPGARFTSGIARATIVDILFAILFPIAFILFVIIYFCA